MDPNAALEKLIKLVLELLGSDDEDDFVIKLREIGDVAADLEDWADKGGFVTWRKR